MDIRVLNRGEAEKAMNEWVASYPQLPSLDGEYAVIRSELTGLFKKVLQLTEENDVKSKEYFIDAEFGMYLYLYLKKQSWFTMRLAADDGFWRYMSLMVIPDAVAVRWGKENDTHYWSQSNRIWLKQLWWYIHLSWNKDETTTRTIVESSNCSTDTILNFVERTGKKGTSVEVYRWIAFFNSIIPTTAVSEYNRKRKTETLFRVVMKLNTARMMVVEPVLCIGGCEGYAKKLFIDAGIDAEYLKY